MSNPNDKVQINWKCDPAALESWKLEAKERGFYSPAAYFNFIATEHMVAREAAKEAQA